MNQVLFTPRRQHISVCGTIFKHIRLHLKSFKPLSSLTPSKFFTACFTFKWLNGNKLRNLWYRLPHNSSYQYFMHRYTPESGLMIMVSYRTFSGQIDHLSGHIKFGQTNLLYTINGKFTKFAKEYECPDNF